MGKVTGKLQITLPKQLAQSHGVRVGDEIEFESRGDAIAIVPARSGAPLLTREERLAQFDAATRRQLARTRRGARARQRSRGWTRVELYSRVRAR